MGGVGHCVKWHACVQHRLNYHFEVELLDGVPHRVSSDRKRGEWCAQWRACDQCDGHRRYCVMLHGECWHHDVEQHDAGQHRVSCNHE